MPLMSRHLLGARRASLIAQAVAVTLVAGVVVALPPAAVSAAAAPPAAPVATPGRGPQKRALPAVAVANHGYPKGTRPPVVPPGVRAAGSPHKATVDDPIDRQASAAVSSAGAVNLILRPGFAFDDTSLVLYFDAADPGISGWTSWRATVYDASTGAAQDSVPLTPADATRCVVPAQYCRSFGATDGWALVGDHPYYVTITVTFGDGTTAVSAASATVKARTTSSPPALPAGQAGGCTCGNALAPTTLGQAVRGAGVNTATGAFALSQRDLSLAGFGVLFDARRMYSSANVTAGSMGIGWSWTYDLKVIPPVAGQTSVTVRAEDGAQVVYAAGSGNAYVRPPGVRSNITKTASGWSLVTPYQTTYTFDTTGRLTSVRDTRGLGVSLAYTATRWTLTDAAGHQILADLGTDGFVHKITLPDGRSVSYGYTGSLMTSFTDAIGSVWGYGYTGQQMTTMTDPAGRVQLTSTYTNGRVTTQVDVTGAATTFAWNPTTQEATTVDADGVPYYDGYRGNVLVYSQNGNGDTVNQRYDQQVDPNLLVDAQGNQLASVYDQASNMTSMTAPDPYSFSVANTYDAHNNLLTQTDGLGHTSQMGYTAFDELASIISPAGEDTTITTDSRGLVTQMTDPRGKTTTLAYDATGNVLSVTSPLGEKTTYTYDTSGRIIDVVSPLGNVAGNRALDYTTTITYDKLDRVTERRRQIKAKGAVTVYDALGQLTKTVDELGHDQVSYAYTSVLGRLASMTDANGNMTSYTYTAAGRRASIVDPLGGKTTVAYDNRGNPAAMVSPRGNVAGANPADFTTSYSYDFNNNRVRISHPYPGGGTIAHDTRFDELNRAVAGIDAFGNTTITRYDNNGNVVSVSDPTGATTGYTYDVDDRPTAVAPPSGAQTLTEYDAAGNVTKSTAANGGVSTYAYDDDGSLASAVDPRGNVSGANPADYTVRYAYDANRQLTGMTDQLGNTTRFAYDPVGRITATTDALGHATTYKYDDADHLTRVIGPDGDSKVSTNYLYDNGGRVLSRTDPLGNIRYTYDKKNRVTDIKDPLNRDTLYTYDAEGNLTQATAPGDTPAEQRSIVYTYDILNRRTRMDEGNGALVYTFGYDALNQRTSLADPGGVRTQTFDTLGRLATASRNGQTFRYAYDANDNITSRTLPDGTVVTAGYNGANQMTSLTAQGGAAGATAAHYTFTYDPVGRPLTTTYPTSTGMVTDRSYNRVGMLADLNTHDSSGTVARQQITRDAVGNPTKVITTRATRSQTMAYTYDPADRVTGACIGVDCATAADKVAYTYDGVGNRLSQTTTGSFGAGSTTYHYDAGSQLTDSVTNRVTTLYAYDRMGNQVQAGAATFTYNLDHTLASATVGGATTTYAYDAQGNRVSSANSAQTRTWQTDINAKVPQLSLETTTPAGGTASTRGFLNGPAGVAMGLLTGTQTDAYAPDFLSGVADVVAPQGGSLASYDQDPFGNPRSNGTAATGASVSNPIQFAGAYQDSTLGGRYAMPARVYDPGTGRFGGVDPVAAPVRQPSPSPYAYSLDRPTVFRDPSGAVPADVACDGLGQNAQHDQAVEMAYVQLAIQHGPSRVYGECPPFARLVSFSQSARRDNVFTIPGPNGGFPELVADLSYITYVWEVKAAADMSKPYRTTGMSKGEAYTAQIDKYVTGLIRMGRFTNVQKGHDIFPEVAPTPDGNSLVIFSADNWQLSFPNAKMAAEPDGIIYYRKIYRARTPAPKMTGTEEGEAEGGVGIGEAAVAPAVTGPPRDGVVEAGFWDPGAWGASLIVGVAVAAVVGCFLSIICGAAVVEEETIGPGILTKSMYALAA